MSKSVLAEISQENSFPCRKGSSIEPLAGTIYDDPSVDAIGQETKRGDFPARKLKNASQPKISPFHLARSDRVRLH